MGTSRIIALDLGKFNSVACILEAGTRHHGFETAATTPEALHELLVKHATADPAQTLVVVEACDVAGWVHDLARSLGCRVAVANCNHEAWKWKKVKRKTDRDDALKLAKMSLNEELPTVHMPSPPQRQRRRLIQHRRVLVARRTQCKNAIRSIYSQQGLTQQLPRGTKAWTRKGWPSWLRTPGRWPSATRRTCGAAGCSWNCNCWRCSISRSWPRSGSWMSWRARMSR